jgi:hypothetical protein
MCSCNPSLTSTLDGVGGQRYTPATLTLQNKSRYTLYRVLGGSKSWPGLTRKISPRWDSILRPPSPWRVALPTELSRPPDRCCRYANVTRVQITVFVGILINTFLMHGQCRTLTLSVPSYIPNFSTPCI